MLFCYFVIVIVVGHHFVDLISSSFLDGDGDSTMSAALWDPSPSHLPQM
jgi:hypothetical protein